MFASRDRRHSDDHVVDVAFTDRWGGVSTGSSATLDLSTGRGGSAAAAAKNWSRLRSAFGVDSVAVMRQVHGADVVQVGGAADDLSPECDALVSTVPEVALCVRVADCVPVVLADVTTGVVAVAHAGRRGVAARVIDATVEAMRARGAGRIEAWVGPHICGGCYEVPASMRRDVSAVAPAAFCCTTWGTPSLDLGAAALDQLHTAGCEPVGHPAACTRESEDLFSYRRQGSDSGRLAGLVVLRNRRGSAPPP